MEFWPFFDIFHWLRPYLCSQRGYLGFQKQATYRRPGDEPIFFTLGSNLHDWKWPKNGPFWKKRKKKKGKRWQACQHSKVVQKGPKGSKRVQKEPKWSTKVFLTIWDPFVGPSGPFWTKWSKSLRLTILVPFGPFWTTLECWQACHVWPFLVQNGPFLGHPQSWTVDPRVKKRLISMSPMCGLLVEPHFTPFGT